MDVWLWKQLGTCLRSASTDRALLTQLKEYTDLCKIISIYVFFLAWVFWAFFGLGSETLKPSALLQVIGHLFSCKLDLTAELTCYERKIVFSVPLLKLSVPPSAPPACQAHGGIRQLSSPDPVITRCQKGQSHSTSFLAVHPCSFPSVALELILSRSKDFKGPKLVEN